MTLNNRITLAVTLLISVITISMLVFVNVRVQRALDENNQQWSRTLALTLAEATLNNILDQKSHQVSETLRRTTRLDSRLAYIIMTDFQGKIFAHTFTENIPDFLTVDADMETWKQETANRYLHFQGMEISETTYPLIEGFDAYIRIGVDLSGLRILARATTTGIILIGAVILVLGLFTAIALARKITLPIRSLSEAMRKYATGDQTELPPFRIIDSDTKQLVDSFEDMISQKSQADEKFLKSHAEFQAIFNSITDAIVFVDLDRRILMINPAFQSMFGYTLDEVAGQTTQIIYANPNEYLQQGNIRYNKSTETDMPVYEIEYRRKDGSIIPGETLGGPVRDANGRTIGFLGVIRDVSERRIAEQETKRLKEQWAQSQRLESIGTLAGGIAHDFNNILGIILGYTELALEDAAGSKVSQDLDKVIQASHRAKDLVQQILAFSRQVQTERVAIKPQMIIKEVLTMIRASIPVTIEIQENISRDCGTVDADPTQLHQITMNLCTNAFHAMEENGGVLKVDLQPADTVPLELIEGTTEPERAFLKLSVSDTGHGIGPDTIDKIFDPFFTTKEKGKGTGMGLSITYGIVKDYGGTIVVDSQLGKGTTFHIYLPQSKQEAAPVTTEETAVSQGKEHILFVDDEELLVEMGKVMLERLGYQVTTRLRSIEALEVFQNQPEIFDLVITDQTMPGMTGIDLARRMLQIRRDIPIILCTGHSNLVDEDVAKNCGIKEFAFKPLTKNSLAQLLRKVLDENQGGAH